MTTIVNNPPSSDNSGSPMGMIIGLVVLVLLVYLFFMYGLPAIRQVGSPQVNVPSEIDVNINQPE